MASAKGGKWRAHIVEKGETLSGIALTYLGNANSWKSLARLNGIERTPDLIHPGDIIKIRCIGR